MAELANSLLLPFPQLVMWKTSALSVCIGDDDLRTTCHRALPENGRSVVGVHARPDQGTQATSNDRFTICNEFNSIQRE
ncbi:hypothetical protein B0H10DRAFT_2233726 [Mycena sp. CBHHK59/15]|nr:hypothetical protein B0H10DRAFT_2233726 [Mycena sp. CBHHK59/15]